MPVRASGGPRAHPNADYAGLPPYLIGALPPAKTPNIPWPPTELAPGSSYYPMVVDREHRVTRVLSGNLHSAIDMLSRSNTSIRDLIRQHETAWMALRALYNQVVILQKLMERLRDMFLNLEHVESVAKDVNVYEEPASDPKEKGKKKAKHAVLPPSTHVHDRVASPTNQTPLAWSNRVLPKVEQMMIEVRGCLADLEGACRQAVLRRQTRLMQDPDAIPLRWADSYIYTMARRLYNYQHQLEVHMTTCKYVHMVSTEKLYRNREGFHLDDSDMYYYLDDGSGSHDRPAFYSFWSSMSVAKAAKKRLEKEKKQRLKQQEQAAEKETSSTPRPGSSRSSKSGKSSKSSKRQSKGKTIEDWTQAPASKEDLLAAIDRKDYLTVVTMLMSDMSLNDMLEDGTFVLSHAVDDDNSALVSILAMCGADPNVRHSSGNTPLHFAANTNCVAPAMLLLEIGAEVDVRDAHGLTPLHVACRERNLSVVLQLLAHGADPNLCDNRGLTPMSYALMHPKRPTILKEMVTTLLTYGARTTGRNVLLSPFIETIFRYDSVLMCRYLQTHPEVLEDEMEVATTGPDGGIVRMRPLYAAILIGNIYAIDQLLRRGADVHHVTPAYGKTMTYLSLAVQGDSTPVVARLLLSNADPNVASIHGRTPLHLAAAAQHGEVEVVELLLRHGADVQAQTHDRHSQALHMAVRIGRADTCFHLLKKGAQVDRPLKSGVTPIMLAVYYNNKSMLRFLMSNGGDFKYKTPQYGETAMHTAARVGNVNLAMILLQQGLSVDASNPFPKSPKSPSPTALVTEEEGPADNNGGNGEAAAAAPSDSPTASASSSSVSRLGYAPIHAAASRGHIDMVRWLLANGADPSARIGRTAARVCLGKDKAKNRASRREKERTADGQPTAKSASYAKYDVGDVEAADSATLTPAFDDQPDDSSDTDLGETPVEVARAFGHERTAGLIEDAVLAASPAAKEYLPTSATSSSSSSSSSSANPLSSDAPPAGPPGPPRRAPASGSKPASQYSLDPVYDSADEGEALAGELRKGNKKVQTSPPPMDGPSGNDANDQDSNDLTE